MRFALYLPPQATQGQRVPLLVYRAGLTCSEETFMLKAGPTHQIVRTNSIDEAVYSSPAIANGRIYIRADKHLFAIGK